MDENNEDMANIAPDPDEPAALRRDEKDWSTAFHEAGHTVTAYLLGFEIGTTTIVPNSVTGQLGSAIGEEPWADGSRDDDFIVSLFAGYAAQRRHDPKADIRGSASDNERAAKLLQSHPELSEGEQRQKAEALVAEHWQEIEALATLLTEENTVVAEDAECICDAIEERGNWRDHLARERDKTREFLRGVQRRDDK